jgi:hypothetical protein
MKVSTFILLSTIFVGMLTGNVNAQDVMGPPVPPGVIYVNLKVYLQGAITNPNSEETSLMRDDLRIAGLIPTISPYPDNATTDATVFNTTGNNAIIDWVWVELRDATNHTIVVNAKLALLQRDGDIVATDGISAVNTEVTSGTYYFAIKHRNHLGILTANAIILSPFENNINLSAYTTDVFGEALALKDMGNGIFAMYAGDVTGDGNILNTDSISAISVSGGVNTYSSADTSMDGNILNTDIVFFTQRNAGRIQQF